MNIPFLFILFIGFIIWLQIALRSSNLKFKKKNIKLTDFLAEDRESNLSRRYELNDKYFVTPDTSCLPVKDYASGTQDKTALRQERALIKSKLTMVRFDAERTNLELKKAYGRAVLEEIIVYEENLQQYIMALLEWAAALIEAEEYDDAEAVLMHSIEIGSDTSRSYTYLADIYVLTGKKRNIQELLSKIESNDYEISNDIIRKKITTYLNSCLD